MVDICFLSRYNVITCFVLFSVAADEHAVGSRGPQLKFSGISATGKGEFS